SRHGREPARRGRAPAEGLRPNAAGGTSWGDADVDVRAAWPERGQRGGLARWAPRRAADEAGRGAGDRRAARAPRAAAVAGVLLRSQPGPSHRAAAARRSGDPAAGDPTP